IGYKEGGDFSIVQLAHELVDARVHDWFADQRQGAVTHGECLLPTFWFHSWNTTSLTNHRLMQLNRFSHNHIRFICFPSPFLANRVLVVTPAEHTFVRACKRWGSFHALIACNA